MSTHQASLAPDLFLRIVYAIPMKRFTLLALAVVALFTLSACNDFLDVNDDPNNASPEDVAGEPGLLFLTAEAQLASNKNIEIIGQNSFAQTWASAGAASVFNNPELYSISTFTTGNTWDAVYTDVGENLQQIIEAAEAAEPGSLPVDAGNVIAQAKILQAYGYFYLTQMFGAVPASQANRADEFPNPAPDTQQEVLRYVITRIDEALEEMDFNAPGIVSRDVFYGGNMDQWRKFGNTIKFRALLLLDSGGEDVTSEINTLLQEPLIRSNADNALFPFSTDQNNENNFFQLSQDFSGDFNGDGVPDNIWYVCNAELVDRMQDLGDPRLGTYCEPNADGEFVGSAPGQFMSVPALGGTGSAVSTNIHRPDYPERFATAAEVLLKEAEWALRQGDPTLAQQKLEDGVAASIDFFDEQPGAIDEADKNAYINSLPDLSSLPQAEALEFIQTQQWLDLFERHPENWTHWRRTKVPELEAPSNASLGTIIRRYTYPPGPASTNPNLPPTRQPDTPMWFEEAN